MIEAVRDNGEIIAIIISKDHRLGENQIEFVTPSEFSLQVRYMERSCGYRVIPHTHHPVRRETVGTQEVLFIKDGLIEIDFYSFEQVYLESRTLGAGDVILLAGAGHGIRMLEATTIVEVKNGPYIEGADKGRFEGVKR
jgi:hypothetical protein